MIIIRSITYSQLYLIKAVISLRVSEYGVNRKSCATRSLCGDYIHPGVSQDLGARGCQQGRAAESVSVPILGLYMG